MFILKVDTVHSSTLLFSFTPYNYTSFYIKQIGNGIDSTRAESGEAAYSAPSR